MKLAFFVALLAGVLAVAGDASAQQPVGPRERFCIEVFDSSGSHPMLCRFETYEQCLLSKTSPQDRCWLNPYLAFQQRR